MLNSMRKLSSGIISKLLMGLLVVSFAVWGVGDILRDSGPSYAAKVGGDRISIGEFQQQHSMLSRQLERMGMSGVEPSKLSMTVIRQLIQQKLTLFAMHDMGLFVNDKLVGKTIATLPDFQGENGKFDAKRFQTTLANQRLNEQAFVDQIKRDIAGKFLADSLDMSDATLPASVLALEQTVSGETRDAVLITIPARDALDEANDTALKEYYEKNKETAYMNPEMRTLEYVTLAQGDIDALVDKAITPEILAQAKASKPNLEEKFLRLQLRSEQRDAAIRNLSNTVEDELAAGKTIAQAFDAAGLKSEPHTLGNVTADLAKISTDDVIKTAAEQGFGLSEGGISGLVSTPKGTLLMVAAKTVTSAAPKPYAEVKADVKSHLGKQLARDAAFAKARAVKEELAKEPNWQAVTEKFKLSNRMVSNVARPVDGKTVNGIPASMQQALFERAIGEAAGPLTLENGDLLIGVPTQSHLPAINPANAANSKDAAKLTEKLVTDIQNRAYFSFTTKHKVEINPAVMKAGSPAEAQ